MIDQQAFYNLPDVTTKLGNCSRSTLYRLIDQGKLVSVKVLGKAVITGTSLAAYIDELMENSGASSYVFIYAIGRPEGPVKIGVSARPAKRLIDLQTACPFNLSVLYSHKCINRLHALDHERLIHEEHADKRMAGEWFNMDKKLATDVIKKSIRGGYDPFTPIQTPNLVPDSQTQIDAE
jgi:predicted DNA-binding transcriptional regulator AlpA